MTHIPILIIASVIGTLFIFRDDLHYLSDRHKNVLCCVSSAIVSVCLHIALMPIYYHLFS
jgi:hypothetical protein